MIDHTILAMKVQLPMPIFIKRWAIAFLMTRQRVKLARDRMSEWTNAPSGALQICTLGAFFVVPLFVESALYCVCVDPSLIIELQPMLRFLIVAGI